MKRTFFIVSLVAVGMSLMAQYQLPRLDYSYSALEPYIDSTTMYIHYNNHHAAYTTNLNKALAEFPDLQKQPVTDLFAQLDKVPETIRTSVRNNGGGYYNHMLFWQMLTPPANSKMTAYVEEVLTANFGSVDRFKEAFGKAAATRFGSGWAWLIKDAGGKYRIISTPNQDNPLMSVVSVNGTPILALDVWEHAYYLKYQSKRADYVSNFWSVVNWKKVEELMKK
ncbi:MAG: superoxide dismutase [Paludibacter sp.]|jgi:Fe-Mn family superoxide dismutase|nr:superoxide dismutase [Paludibacter sp.]